MFILIYVPAVYSVCIFTNNEVQSMVVYDNNIVCINLNPYSLGDQNDFRIKAKRCRAYRSDNHDPDFINSGNQQIF